jgi:serine/threonine protein kinase
MPPTFTTISSNNSNSNKNSHADDEKIGPNNFIPIKMLGSGSFGEVYLVKEKKTSKLYAMKVLSKQKIMGQNLVRYAKTERDVLSYTKHPFIVNLNYAF